MMCCTLTTLNSERYLMPEIPPNTLEEMCKIPDSEIETCPITEEILSTDLVLGQVPKQLKQLYMLGEKIIAHSKRLVAASDRRKFDDDTQRQLDDHQLGMKLMPLSDTVNNLSLLFFLCLREHFNVPQSQGWDIALRKDWTVVKYKSKPGQRSDQ